VTCSNQVWSSSWRSGTGERPTASPRCGLRVARDLHHDLLTPVPSDCDVEPGRPARDATLERDGRHPCPPRRHLRQSQITAGLAPAGLPRDTQAHGAAPRLQRRRRHDNRGRKLRTAIPDVSASPLTDLIRHDFAPYERRGAVAATRTSASPNSQRLCYRASLLDLGGRPRHGFRPQPSQPVSLARVPGALPPPRHCPLAQPHGLLPRRRRRGSPRVQRPINLPPDQRCPSTAKHVWT